MILILNLSLVRGDALRRIPSFLIQLSLLRLPVADLLPKHEL